LLAWLVRRLDCRLDHCRHRAFVFAMSATCFSLGGGRGGRQQLVQRRILVFGSGSSSSSSGGFSGGGGSFGGGGASGSGRSGADMGIKRIGRHLIAHRWRVRRIFPPR
jgi:uncharacterized membrane protein YgcG